MVRMQRIVSGTWLVTLATALRYSVWALSIRFCTTRVKRATAGIRSRRSRASPRFLTVMMAKMLTILHRSAAMLMMPAVNSDSTVSTSPTK